MGPNSSNSLGNAMLPDQMQQHARWYTYHSQMVHNNMFAQFAKGRRYEELEQPRYLAQSIFYDAQPSVSFLNEAGEPTPLHVMLDKDFGKPRWEYPWTQAQVVGQKITIRVRLNNCSFNRQINVRRFTNSSEACTKSKLGYEIAKALHEQWTAGIAFEDVVLYELRHVSQGSWQPILGVKLDETAMEPVSISQESFYDSGNAPCLSSPLCRVAS